METVFGQLNAVRDGVRTSSLNADLSEWQAEFTMPELQSVTEAVGEIASSCWATTKGLRSLYANVGATC